MEFGNSFSLFKIKDIVEDMLRYKNAPKEIEQGKKNVGGVVGKGEIEKVGGGGEKGGQKGGGFSELMD